MSTCVYCHQKKGKRPCPALNGLICAPCCGEHRVTRIACPPDCEFLASGSDYQQQRLGEQLAPLRREFYREIAELGGDQAGALFNLVEVAAFGYFQGRRDGQDAEVVAGLQALRRSLSPLHVPSGPLAVFAEHLMNQGPCEHMLALFKASESERTDQPSSTPADAATLGEATRKQPSRWEVDSGGGDE